MKRLFTPNLWIFLFPVMLTIWLLSSPVSETSTVVETEPTASSSLSSCESAMKATAAISDMQDTVEDLDPTIRACATLDEFITASSKYPEALDGADEETVIVNRCKYNLTLQDTALCRAVP